MGFFIDRGLVSDFSVEISWSHSRKKTAGTSTWASDPVWVDVPSYKEMVSYNIVFVLSLCWLLQLWYSLETKLKCAPNLGVQYPCNYQMVYIPTREAVCCTRAFYKWYDPLSIFMMTCTSVENIFISSGSGLRLGSLYGPIFVRNMLMVSESYKYTWDSRILPLAHVHKSATLLLQTSNIAYESLFLCSPSSKHAKI